MIKISFNAELQKVIIKLYDVKSSFDDIIMVLRKYSCKFDKVSKSYQSIPSIYEDLKIELGDFDQIEAHPYTEQLIANACIVPVNIKRYRASFDDTLLQYKPLVGKHPHETYQTDDIKQIMSYNRHGCFWYMGLGKAMAISYILTFLFKYNKISHAVLIISPDGLMNLKFEIMKFNNQFTDKDFFIASRFNKNIFDRTDYKILLCTYSTWIVLNNHYYTQSQLCRRKRHEGKLVPITLAEIKKDQPKCFEKMTIDFNKFWGNNNKLIMLDESHMIANANSKTSKYIHLYKNLFEYRYIFSGSPYDKYEKLYSQMTFLDDSLIPKTYHQWLLEIADCGNRFNAWAINDYKLDKVNKFLDHILPYVVQRGKEALDLPEHIIEKNYIEVSKQQRLIYNYLVDFQLFLQDQIYYELDFDRIYNLFPYLIQALDNPCLLQGKLENKFNYHNFDTLIDLINQWKFKDHSKFETLDYLVRQYIDEENRKIILWSYHPDTINSLCEYYKKYDPLYIHGQMGVPEKERVGLINHIVQEFKTKPDCHLLIASQTVLQRSVTITEATRQIYFDRDFSTTKFDQSSSRIYRPGSKEIVKTNILIFLKSLDIHLDQIIEQKTDIGQTLLKKKYLTIKEIELLFRGENLE